MGETTAIRTQADFSFEFLTPENTPNPVLRMEDVTAGYTDEEKQIPIVHGIRFSLQPGQRIGLLGVNGAGKSTFIKTLVGEIEQLSGKITKGKGLNIGYFAQYQINYLRNDESPVWHIMKITPDAREQDVRNFLGGFNFHGEMATESVAPLSGGEKARLALAMIVWQKPNLILLDEPTNHLDLQTREALTEALAQFEGTLILVSHDRYLLRATTDEFIIVSDGKLQSFNGDLDDYRDQLLKTKNNTQDAEKDGEKQLDRRAQRRKEAEARQQLSALKKPIETRIKFLESEMQKYQTQKNNIEKQLSDTSLYENTQKEKLKKILSEQAECTRRLNELEEEWLEKQGELENILSAPV